MKNVCWYARMLDLFLSYVMVPVVVVGSVLNELGIPLKNFGDGNVYINPSTTFFTVPFTSQILWVVIHSISWGFLIMGFVYFKRLLRCYQSGEIFSEKTFLYFYQMSRMVFFLIIYMPIQRTLMTLVKTLHNPVGQRCLSLSITSNDITNIFIVGFFFMMASLMYEGYKLKKDQDLTV